MKLNFSKFNSSELENSELFPISGGTSSTRCGDYKTFSTGADGDGTNFDGDSDFY